MAVLDRNIIDVFRHRIERYCEVLENEIEAEEIVKFCVFIENSAKALRKLAIDEVKSEPDA
jgi:hypothetical protein